MHRFSVFEIEEVDRAQSRLKIPRRNFSDTHEGYSNWVGLNIRPVVPSALSAVAGIINRYEILSWLGSIWFTQSPGRIGKFFVSSPPEDPFVCGVIQTDPK